MEKIIIEVGSTTTKVDGIEDKKITRIQEEIIFFKKNYQKEKEIYKEDVKALITLVKNAKQMANEVYVCGTSIFRELPENQKQEFLQTFEENTGCIFHVISQEEENRLTVEGAGKNIGQKACVFVGGGGSTEIAVYEGKITQTSNTKMGVVDIMQVFPDLGEDVATSSLEEIKDYIRKRIYVPKEKADILILAGGGHQFFALHSGFYYENNTLYQDDRQKIMMPIEQRRQDTKAYIEKVSLDSIRNKTKDPAWWWATRAMCAEVLVVAEEIGAKYIVPTDISMVYGLIDETNFIKG